MVLFLFSLAAVFELYTRRAQQFSKMVTGEEKAYAVLELHSHQFVITVQRYFRTMFEQDAPCANSIRRWYVQFKATGCLCEWKSMGRPPMSQEKVRACGWISHVAYRNQRAKRAESWTFHNRPFGRSYGKYWSRSLTTSNCYKPLHPSTKEVVLNFVYKCNSLWKRMVFWETCLQWWSNILCEWNSEQAQCANLGHRKSPCY